MFFWFIKTNLPLPLSAKVHPLYILTPVKVKQHRASQRKDKGNTEWLGH